MENEDKKQEELKKKAIITDLFIKFADKIKLDDKEVPKTEKGMATKAKELMEKLERKIEKIPEEEKEVFQLKKKRLKNDLDKD